MIRVVEMRDLNNLTSVLLMNVALSSVPAMHDVYFIFSSHRTEKENISLAKNQQNHFQATEKSFFFA